jgi:hypothetical protein
VKNVTKSAATIAWQTDISATSQVEYGLTPAYGSLSDLDSDLVTSHTVRLTGLAQGTTYNFRVLSNSDQGTPAQSANFTFSTKP